MYNGKEITNLQLLTLVGLYILSCVAVVKVRKWDRKKQLEKGA